MKELQSPLLPSLGSYLMIWGFVSGCIEIVVVVLVRYGENYICPGVWCSDL